MRYLRLCIAVGVAAACFGLGRAPAAEANKAEQKKEAEKPAAKEAAFEMREIDVFKSVPIHMELLRGQAASCSKEPSKEVKAYPKLKSKSPWYGSVKFGNVLDPAKAVEYFFVVDESGETPPEAKKEPAKEKPKEESSLLKTLSKALGSSEGPKDAAAPAAPKRSTYDRLYIDLNHDLDLTNDPPLGPGKESLLQSLPQYGSQEKQVFAYLEMPFDFGQGIGQKPVRLLPWMAAEGQYATVFFMRTTAREGQIVVGKRKFQALLAQPYAIAGRYDQAAAGVFLRLTPADGVTENRYQGGFVGDSLALLRRYDNVLYTFAATPLGDRLIVKPYDGDYGVLEVGAGGRDLKQFSLQGSLRSKEHAFQIGSDDDPGARSEVRKVEVPVGDYLASYVSVQFGHLSINFSDNYHADGKPRAIGPRVYSFAIRKDKPFVLDFSNKPEVLFANPPKNKTVKLGEEVPVAAVLVDPKLDIMIRHLMDADVKEKQTYKDANGNEQSYEQPRSLDPMVTVTNSKGEKIAGGKMPFG
jgi:hypothetical protein